MEKPATRPWDPAEYLQDEEDIQAFLEAVREEHDPGLSQDAREIIARARAMNQQRRREGNDQKIALLPDPERVNENAA